MRVIPRPRCLLCGADGTQLYQGLRDRLHHTEGTWNMVKCSNAECGMLWLDPAPAPEDLPLAYQRYYTHEGPVTPTALQRIWARLVPGRLAIERMYLGNSRPGRLLEVGCGNGARLGRLMRLGWLVEGQEIDRASAEIARRNGLTIHLGELASLGLLEETFDAVVLNHVVEHAVDPVGLLDSCRHLMKPDAVLVLATPNASGAGHAAMGAEWAWLDPPRHLQVFNRASLESAARSAGFVDISVWSSAARAQASAATTYLAQRGGDGATLRPVDHLRALALQLFASLRHPFAPMSGDELVLWARRRCQAEGSRETT